MPSGAEERQRRQSAILELIREARVSRQSELVELLRQRGIEATQSSISRDLRQLGISKYGQGYRRVAGGDPDAREAAMLSELVRTVRTAGANLTVIGTAVGAAQRVAVYLDRADWPEIVGTVSGDDTIFVATENAAAQRRLLAQLNQVFEN